jgi:hypothetical protein
MGELSPRTLVHCLLTQAEVDLLHQLPFHRSWRPASHPVLESQTGTELVDRKASSNRLCRNCPIRRKYVVFPNSPQLGWCLL